MDNFFITQLTFDNFIPTSEYKLLPIGNLTVKESHEMLDEVNVKLHLFRDLKYGSGFYPYTWWAQPASSEK